MGKKILTNWKIVFVINAAIVVIMLGYFFLWKKFIVIDDQPQQAVHTISNWKTYTNTKYNYHIKYPADWIVEIDGKVVWQNQVPNPERGKDIMFFGTKTEPYGQTTKILWRIVVFINPQENLKKLSPRDWFIEQSKLHFSYGVEQKFDNLEDTTFKGFPALKVKERTGGEYDLLVAKDTLIYYLSLSVERFEDGELDTSPEQIFLQMLDSFVLN